MPTMHNGSPVETFLRDGVVVLHGFYPAAQISAHLKEFEIAEQAEQLGSVDQGGTVMEKIEEKSSVKYVQGINHFVRSLNSLQSLALLKLAGTLLDDEVYFAEMELHDKAARGGSETPPHQDNFYFCFDPAKALTVYVPLERHGPANGGLEFVVGSHVGGVRPHRPAKVKAFSSYLEGYENSETLAPDIGPGDIIVHHCNTIHLAKANQSSHRRRSISMRVNGFSATISPKLKDLYAQYRADNRI